METLISPFTSVSMRTTVTRETPAISASLPATGLLRTLLP